MKRPMFYLGLAFVFGEILGFVWQKLWLILWLAMAVFGVWSGRKKTHILEKICFFLLPVFALWGSASVWHVTADEQTALSIADAMPSVYEGVVIEKEIKEKVAVLIVRCDMPQSAVHDLKIRCMVSLNVSKTDEAANPQSMDDAVDLSRQEGRLDVINAEDVGMYDKIVLRGQAEVIEGAANPGCYDAYAVYRLEQVYYQISDCEIIDIIENGSICLAWLEKLKSRMRAVIYASLNEDLAGILTAMITGDKSGIPDEINSLYQSQGIAHIMAISGLHVTMAGMGLGGILKRLYVPAPFRQMISMVTVLAYICMCGFSASSVRAMIMFDAVVIGELIGRKEDSATVLLLAAMVILIHEPLALFSFSFLMSFGCIASLIIMRSLDGKRAGVYITITTMPLMAWFQYEISAYSILLNLVVVPAMSVLFPMGLVGSLAGCLWLPAGKMLCVGAGVILKIYEQLCLVTQRMPLSVIITGKPQIWEMCVIYAALGLFYLLTGVGQCHKKDVAAGNGNDNGKRKGKGKGTAWFGTSLRYLLLLPLFLLFWNPPPSQLEVLFLDVGQGDACIIRTPLNQTVMIDGGSSSESEVGKYTISKVLKYYGIDTIDYMILSHMDKDHVNGALWLLENRWQVGQIVLSGIIYDLDMRSELIHLAAENNIPVTQVFAGDELVLESVHCQENRELALENVHCQENRELALESVHCQENPELALESVRCHGSSALEQDGFAMILRCLHPQDNFISDSDNAASAVIELVCGQCRFLFAGDVEGDGEAQMLDYMQRKEVDINLKATILKVAHHGSKNSTSEEFLNYVNPDYAIISCGKNNIYGHPHEALLQRLENAGCISAITADSGAVLVQCDGVKAEVFAYK